MPDQSWLVIEEVSGSGLAEILRGLLEAQEIPVLLSQEGAGHFGYAVTTGRLGLVQILVPAEFEAKAQQALADYHSGRLAAAGDNLDSGAEQTENNPQG